MEANFAFETNAYAYACTRTLTRMHTRIYTLLTCYSSIGVCGTTDKTIKYGFFHEGLIPRRGVIFDNFKDGFAFNDLMTR